jgi:hypothetical protein
MTGTTDIVQLLIIVFCLPVVVVLVGLPIVLVVRVLLAITGAG